MAALAVLAIVGPVGEALASMWTMPLPLDEVAGATHAYGLRKLSSTYAGSAIRVRRVVSGQPDAFQDIGFTAAGELDASALLSFVGSGSAYITHWYDQSGNGQHAVQPDATRQPQIVSAGALRTSGPANRPGLYFNNSGAGTFADPRNWLDVPITYNTGNTITLFSVANRTAQTVGSQYPRWWSLADNASNDFQNASGFQIHTWPNSGGTANRFAAGHNNKFLSGPTQSLNTLYVLAAERDGALVTLGVNGSEVTDNTYGTANFNIQRGRIGNNQQIADSGVLGYISENLLYTAALSAASRQLLSTNEQVYFGLLANTASLGAGGSDPVYVMLWTSGDSTPHYPINVSNGIVADASDPMYASLASQYAGWDILLRFNGGQAQASAFQHSFGADSGVVVSQVEAVLAPEPGMALVGLALAALAGLRRARPASLGRP